MYSHLTFSALKKNLDFLSPLNPTSAFIVPIIKLALLIIKYRYGKEIIVHNT